METLSYATLEQIVTASVQGILLLEVHGPSVRIRYANPAYERLSGYAARELVGNDWSTHFAGDSVDSSENEALDRLVARGMPGSCSLACLCKDGTEWRCEVYLSRVGGAGREATLILAQHVVEGLSLSAADKEQGTDSAQLDHSAIRRLDRSPRRPGPLAAGMLSTNQFMALLGRDLAIARRHDRDVTLFLFEISEYDIYRQTFGQLAADACARMVATQILGTFGRAIDLRARLDESSFVVAVQEQPEEQSQRLAKLVVEKTARLSLPNPRARSGSHVEIASVVVRADPENDDAAALIERAGKCLSRGEPEAEALRAVG